MPPTTATISPTITYANAILPPNTLMSNTSEPRSTIGEDIRNEKTDGVVIVATDEADEHILINKEYRMSVGDYVYNFPAGLIDEGETRVTAAKRELKEETGLDLIAIEDKLYDSYSAIGFSNETNAVVIGKATGKFSPSTSTFEEITAAWYSKEEVKALLKNKHFAARTQAFCYMWARN